MNIIFLFLFFYVNGWVFRKVIDANGRKTVIIDGNRLLIGASEIVNIPVGSNIKIQFKSGFFDWQLEDSQGEFLQLLDITDHNINQFKQKQFRFFVNPDAFFDQYKFYKHQLIFTRKNDLNQQLQKRLYITVDPSNNQAKIILRRLPKDTVVKNFNNQFNNQQINLQPQIQNQINNLQINNQQEIQPLKTQQLLYNNLQINSQQEIQPIQQQFLSGRRPLQRFQKRKKNNYDNVLKALKNDDENVIELLEQLDLTS